jgi:hypothetical protein
MDETMYLPENHAQMYDILSELRIYAAMNGLAHLAEELDDALVLLAADGQCGGKTLRPVPAAHDKL